MTTCDDFVEIKHLICCVKQYFILEFGIIWTPTLVNRNVALIFCVFAKVVGEVVVVVVTVVVVSSYSRSC